MVTIGNLSCREDVEISLESLGLELPATGKARMLATADIPAHNTFEDPEVVVPTEFDFDPTKPLTIPKAAVVAVSF